MTAAALEEYGPGLIAHCIARWFIDNKIPAEFIARLPSDPHDLPDGGKSPSSFLLIINMLIYRSFYA